MEVQVPSVRNLFLYLSQIGIDVQELKNKTGISDWELENTEGFIDSEKTANLLNALQELNNPFFGLEIGAQITPPFAGVVGHLVQSSANVLIALENSCRFHHLYGQGLHFFYTDKDDFISISFSSEELKSTSLFLYRQLIELQASWFVNLIHFLSGTWVYPVSLFFDWKNEMDLEKYYAIFGKNIVLNFEEGKNSIVFRKADLTLAVISKNDFIFEMFQKICQDRLEDLQGTHFLSRKIKKWLFENYSKGVICSIDILAEHQNMSKRTLQRKLKSEGTSYREILDKVRKEIALDFLKKPLVDVLWLSDKLGFQDEKSLRRAFQNWTNQSLSNYQKQK